MPHMMDYGDARLTDGPLKAQFDQAVAYYSALDEDRLLKVYRQAARQPAPGADLGGWYNPGAFAPGHCLGQVIAALSRFAVITDDCAIVDKVERLVDGFAATLESDSCFYDGHRFRAYVYDKHVLGLTEAYRLLGIAQARRILSRATDLALRYIPEKALTREQQAQRPHRDVSYTWDESYTLAEHLFHAYDTFGDERYSELARRYLHDEPMFKPLARGENILPHLHAYSHMNALSSAARAAIALGSEMHLAAARNAWEMIEQTQSYATGGWGPDEAFVEPGLGLLGKSLTTTRKHFETPCGTYAHMKLARYLLRLTGDARYADGLERIIYNGMLAAREMGPEGQTFYYSDYAAAARKTYHPERWPCCAGTYPLAVGDYAVSAYWHDDTGVYVNLYAPSRLAFRSADGTAVKLALQTEYPLRPDIRVTVESVTPSRFAIHLRLPQWTDSRVSVSVNGRQVEQSLTPGTFLRLQRSWSGGDVIDMSIPLPWRAQPVDEQHPDRVALMRGPLVMVATGDGDWPSDPRPQRLRPFFQVREETYTMYLPAAAASARLG